MSAVLVLQLVQGVSVLAFGLLAAGIARRTPAASGPRRIAWLLAAWCFVPSGILAVAQGWFAMRAVAAGPGSATWELYMVWSPGANYARMLVVVVLAIALLALSARNGRSAALVPVVVPVLFLALGAGFVAGLLEGPLGVSHHLTRTTVVTAVTVVLLLAALLVATTTDVLDQLLWLALAAYTFKQAISVSMFTILAWLDFSTGVSPLTLYAMHVAGWVVILLFALRRYHAAVRRREVPALFERVDSLRKHRVLT